MERKARALLVPSQANRCCAQFLSRGGGLDSVPHPAPGSNPRDKKRPELWHLAPP